MAFELTDDNNAKRKFSRPFDNLKALFRNTHVVVDVTFLEKGVQVDVIRLPFGIQINFGLISFLFTILWIAGITNAVNLIDGLDGLAGGMSVIILW